MCFDVACGGPRSLRAPEERRATVAVAYLLLLVLQTLLQLPLLLLQLLHLFGHDEVGVQLLQILLPS